jgi:hypothetical protein
MHEKKHGHLHNAAGVLKTMIRLKFYAAPFLYVLLINISVILATVVLHETGHAILGDNLGCTNIKIVIYDQQNSNTYTQMSCPNNVTIEPLALAGFLLIIPYALLFVFLKRFSEKHFSIIIMGFNFMLSLPDLVAVTGSVLLSSVITMIGALLVVLGEALFIDKALYSR